MSTITWMGVVTGRFYPKRRPLKPACPCCGSKWTVQTHVEPYCTATCQFLANRKTT